MKRIYISILAFALIFLFCFSGCEANARDFRYISGDIECEVSFEKNGRAVRAVIHKSEASGEDVRICLLEPQSIAGLEIVRADGIVSVCFEGLRIESESFSSLVEIERFFEYDSRIKSTQRLKGSAEMITVSRSSGEEFLLLLEGGIPVAIRGELFGEELEIRIIRFAGDILGEGK